MKKHYVEADEAEINLTPMLDVVFIMLIFFIVTSSFIKESGLDVSRPQSGGAEKTEQGNIVVSITSDDLIFIDRRQIDARAVRANIERLHAENPTGAVVIQGEEDAKNGLIVLVLDAARLVGVENVSLAGEVAD